MKALAYTLADRVNALFASDLFQQKSMGMEPGEFRDYLAEEINRVLVGMPSRDLPRQKATKTRRDAGGDRDGLEGHITDQAAKRLLEGVPVEVRRVYEQRRQDGATPAESLEGAVKFLERERERAGESQLDDEMHVNVMAPFPATRV